MKKVFIDKSSGIYAIINSVNGKCYVGSSCNLQLRSSQHLRKLKTNKHHSKILQNAFNKYGENSFSFELVEFVSDLKKLIEREQFWADFLKPEYNACKIVVNTRLGVKISEETKRKISDVQKGKHPSPEALKNIRAAALKKKGIPLSEERRKKIGLGNLGKVRTEEAKRKNSEANLGKKISKEAILKCQKTKQERGTFKGYKWSEEAKKRVSVLRKGRITSDKTKQLLREINLNRVLSETHKKSVSDAKKINHHMSRMVLNTQNGIFYRTLNQAYDAYSGLMSFRQFKRRIDGKIIRNHAKSSVNFIYVEGTKKTKPIKQINQSEQTFRRVFNNVKGVVYNSIKLAHESCDEKMTFRAFKYRVEKGKMKDFSFVDEGRKYSVKRAA